MHPHADTPLLIRAQERIGLTTTTTQFQKGRRSGSSLVLFVFLDPFLAPVGLLIAPRHAWPVANPWVMDVRSNRLGESSSLCSYSHYI